MSKRLDRFAKNPATTVDYLAIAKADYVRMEGIADKMKAQRDELAVVLRQAELKLRAMASEFNKTNFTDRYGDGPEMLQIANKARATLTKVQS